MSSDEVIYDLQSPEQLDHQQVEFWCESVLREHWPNNHLDECTLSTIRNIFDRTGVTRSSIPSILSHISCIQSRISNLDKDIKNKYMIIESKNNIYSMYRYMLCFYISFSYVEDKEIYTVDCLSIIWKYYIDFKIYFINFASFLSIFNKDLWDLMSALGFIAAVKNSEFKREFDNSEFNYIYNNIYKYL
eukprot:GHVL01031165.1.p1 GENE.GHVL01031165.1~~GHVL01031165.1.p1  ORF type:complete len:189 (-),score=41.63 GHVL01031165.1:106-672(-)